MTKAEFKNIWDWAAKKWPRLDSGMERTIWFDRLSKYRLEIVEPSLREWYENIENPNLLPDLNTIANICARRLGELLEKKVDEIPVKSKFIVIGSDPRFGEMMADVQSAGVRKGNSDFKTIGESLLEAYDVHVRQPALKDHERNFADEKSE